MKKIILFLILGIFLISLVNAQYFCDDIYFFVLENNWEFNETDLTECNITQDMIDNYYDNCDRILPNKPTEKNLTKIINISDRCDYETNKFLGASIPTSYYNSFDFNLGEISCTSVNIMKYIVRVEPVSSYSITGIRIFPLVLIGISIFTIMAIKSNSWLNKLIKKKVLNRQDV